MGIMEKTIVTNIMFGLSVAAGFITAGVTYTKGMAGYMKIFHKDLWTKACEEVTKEM